MTNETAQDILDAMSAPNHKNVYAIGCFENRITIYSQQLRALNLAKALIQSGVINKEKNIAIIGGGIAGITFAAALANFECQINIYEASQHLFHMQSGNRSRYLHPNIYDWPWTLPKYALPQTFLPFMNWMHGRTDEVISDMFDDVENLKKYSNVKIELEVKITEIEEHNGFLKLFKGEALAPRTFDVVVYAGGFGSEFSFINDRTTSYWYNDLYDQIFRDVEIGEKRKIAILGCGDGGLTDCIRIAIRDFDQTRFFKKIAYNKEFKELGRIMETIDNAIDPSLNKEQESLWLREQYFKKIRLPNSWYDFLEGKRRTDLLEILLVSKYPSPYTVDTSILNRLLVFALHDSKSFKFEQKLVDEKVVEEYKKDQYTVIERIGPKKHAYEFFKIKPEDAEDKIIALDRLNIGTEKYFESSFFGHLNHEQQTKPILLIYNSGSKNLNKKISRVEIKLTDLSKKSTMRPVFNNLMLDPAVSKAAKNIDSFTKEVDKIQPELIIFLSSDLFYLCDHVPAHLENIVITGEETLVESCFNKLSLSGSSKYIYGLGQQIKWVDICDLLKELPAKKIGFIVEDDYVVDKEFCSLLIDFIKNNPENYHDLEITPVKIGDIDRVKNDFDIFTGRYFAHLNLHILRDKKVPFASPFHNDIDDGAILSFDIPDEIIANRLAENIVFKILSEGIQDNEIDFVSGAEARLNLKNAKQLGFNFSNSFIKKLKNYK